MADLRAGKITSMDLTNLYIRRIGQFDQKLNAKLNAVVVRAFERARQQARSADQGGIGTFAPDDVIVGVRPDGVIFCGDIIYQRAHPVPGRGQQRATSPSPATTFVTSARRWAAPSPTC